MSKNKGLKVLQEKELQDKVCVVVGTRPGIIKMSPIIKELEKRGINHFVIHAGQHYSYNMNEKFFEDLGLSEPEYVIESTKEYKLHGAQTAEMLRGVEEALIEEKPKITLVCGDANFNLAGALAARKLRIKVGHVEAGLRSDDWRMPEEHNRVMIDHISDYLFAPTEEGRQNATKDNVKGEVIVTGNTIVDAVYQNLELAEENSNILSELNLNKENYFLVTAHREENIDSRENLSRLLKILEKIGKNYPNKKIIYPIHPRSQDRLEKFDLKQRGNSIENLNLIEPLGYLDFLLLLKNAKAVLTDSGGIQEESCIMKVPCITLRKSTERPETVQVGSNIVTGLNPSKVLESLNKMIKKPKNWENPFGDGTASEKIVNKSVEMLENVEKSS